VEVVQVQVEKYRAKVLVFVDGVSLDDGSTLEDWRTRKPVAIDGFEQAFGGPFFGPWGALFFGVLGALPFAAEYSRTRDPSWLAGAITAFLICAGWWSAGILLIRWLKTKRCWPAPVRRLLVPCVLLGVPIAVVMAGAVLIPKP
jgi:hypothetical protein